MSRRSTLVLLTLGCILPSSALAASEQVDWAILPARGESPPPADPTLLRLTKSIGEAIHQVVERSVKVVSRELRDDACPSPEAECPRDIAVFVSADRAVSLLLAPDRSELTMRVYRTKIGLEKELTLPCKWAQGVIACDTKQFDEQFTPQKMKKLGKKEVERAFAKLKDAVTACKERGWGDIAQSKRAAQATVSFRVDGSGRTHEVRVSPKQIQTAPAYSCMARAVESLSFDKSGAGLKPFRFPLPGL